MKRILFVLGLLFILVGCSSVGINEVVRENLYDKSGNKIDILSMDEGQKNSIFKNGLYIDEKLDTSKIPEGGAQLLFGANAYDKLMDKVGEAYGETHGGIGYSSPSAKKLGKILFNELKINQEQVNLYFQGSLNLLVLNSFIEFGISQRGITLNSTSLGLFDGDASTYKKRGYILSQWKPVSSL